MLRNNYLINKNPEAPDRGRRRFANWTVFDYAAARQSFWFPVVLPPFLPLSGYRRLPARHFVK